MLLLLHSSFDWWSNLSPPSSTLPCSRLDSTSQLTESVLAQLVKLLTLSILQITGPGADVWISLDLFCVYSHSMPMPIHWIQCLPCSLLSTYSTLFVMCSHIHSTLLMLVPLWSFILVYILANLLAKKEKQKWSTWILYSLHIIWM